MAMAKRGTDKAVAQTGGPRGGDVMMRAPTDQVVTALAGPIDLRIDGGYIIAKHDDTITIYELIWEKRHGDSHQKLTLRECVEVPRQFEALVYHR